MKSVTNEQQTPCQNAKIYICKGKFEDKHAKDRKNIVKLGTIVVMQGNIEVLHIAYVLSSVVYLKKLLYFFTTYLTMIIIWSVRKIIYWLGENTERYITFSIPKEVSNIEENIEQITKAIFFKLQLIDRARFKGSSLLNLDNNLVLEFINWNVKADTTIKHLKLVELNTKIATAFLDTQILKIF